jgi:hypothetical protein
VRVANAPVSTDGAEHHYVQGGGQEQGDREEGAVGLELFVREVKEVRSPPECQSR